MDPGAVSIPRPAAPTRCARNPWLCELRATAALAGPIVATQLGEIAILTIDVLMLARLNTAALAAGTLASDVFQFFLLFAIGVVQAVQPLAAQAEGGREPDGVRRTVCQGLWMAGAVTLPLIAVLSFAPAMLDAFGQDAATADAAGDYIAAARWGLPGAAAFMALRSFVAALSRPGLALAVMWAGVGLNVALNRVLIFGALGVPALGVMGAGLASAVVNTAMAAGLLAAVLWTPRLRAYRVLDRLSAPDWARFAAIARLGLPIALTMVCEVGVFTAATLMMGTLGDIPLAAHGIAIKVASTTFMVPLGIGLAATVRVGLAQGARDPAGVRRAGWTAFVLAGAVMAAASALLLTAPDLLIGLFRNPADPANADVVAVARSLLLIAAGFQLVDGVQVVGQNVLRGLSDVRVPFAIALTGYWGVGIGFAWVLTFPIGLGPAGIWLGLGAGLAAVALLLLNRFRRRERLRLVAGP